jgi:hypothetical protein
MKLKGHASSMRHASSVICLVLFSFFGTTGRAELNGIPNIEARTYRLTKGSPKECPSSLFPEIRLEDKKQKVIQLDEHLSFKWANYKTSFPDALPCPEETSQTVINTKDQTTIVSETHGPPCGKGTPNTSLRLTLFLKAGREIIVKSEPLKLSGRQFVIDPSVPSMTCRWR